MDILTAQRLCEINNNFYREHCSSFTATRQNPQRGWQRCLEELGWTKRAERDRVTIPHPVLDNPAPTLFVFDLACGNLRFESFLQQALPTVGFEFYAVDGCNALLPHDALNVHYQNLDIIETVLRGQELNTRFQAPPCGLAVCFGFMHHVPTQALRELILNALLTQSQPQGLTIVSFWQFMSDDKLAGKAVETNTKALAELALPGLEENDFLLGWQETSNAWRYCHSFTDGEIDELIKAVSTRAIPVSRFKSDGKTGTLATYVIFRTIG